MRWGKKKGRIAAGFSVSLHAAVYVGLAAGGFFTVLQHYSRQPNVTDVMIYNAGDMAGAGGQDASGTDAVSRDGGGAYDQQERAMSTPEQAPNEEVRPTVDATPLTPDALTYAVDRNLPTKKERRKRREFSVSPFRLLREKHQDRVTIMVRPGLREGGRPVTGRRILWLRQEIFMFPMKWRTFSTASRPYSLISYRKPG